MKIRTVIMAFFISMLVGITINFSSCQQWDSSVAQTRLSTAGGAMFMAPDNEEEPVPENSSKKWQQMIASDMNSLQVGDAKTAKGQVHVVSYHPQGQTRSIDAVDEINITFSEPVAPLKKIEKNQPSLITVTPAVKGEGFWKSSTTYSYRVDQKLKLSSLYKVHFKGYKAFSGKTVPPKLWNFSTPTISIRRTKPYHRNKWQTLDQKVLVHFTQDVDPTGIEDFITVVTPKGKHPFTVRYSTRDERKLLYYWAKDTKDTKRFVTVSPQVNLPIASDIHVRFLQGLPSTEGNLGLGQERQLTFRTFEIFKISSVSNQFRANQGIRVIFTNPVQLKHFREKVSFEPEVKIQQGGNWTSHDFYVYGNFQPGITYTMTVPADVQDQFGNLLGQEQTYKILCLDYTPFLLPPYPKHFVLEDYLDKKMPLDVRNVFETNVNYNKLELADLKKIFIKGYPQPGNFSRDKHDTFFWKLPVKKNRNYTLGFDLETINIGQQGFYYINFNNATRYGYSGHVFQLTDIALVAKYSPSQLFLVPFNLKTGELVPEMEFKIESIRTKKGTEGISAQIIGNSTGIAAYIPPVNLLKGNRLLDCFVFSEPKKAFVWGQKSPMFDMWEFEYGSAGVNYNYNPNYYRNLLMTFTDKHLYKAGQNVKFKGILRQLLAGKMTIPAVEYVKMEVYNSRSESIYANNLPGDEITAYGSFGGEFALPANAPTGFYRIKFEGKMGGTIVEDSLTFSVQEYKPAKFEVKVNLDQKRLIAGQPFSGSINGRYLFGTPMRRAENSTTWTLRSTFFKPPGWEGFSFGTSDSFYRNTIYNKTSKLDDEGIYRFNSDKLTYTGKNSVRLTVYGDIKDKDNNRIGSSRSITVHRGEFYIGMKTGSYFFKQNKPGKLILITPDPGGVLKKDTSLHLKIIREEWKSFQQKDASGALRWEWKKQTHGILEEDLDLPSGKFEKEYTFDTPGFYRAEVTGKDSLGNTVTTSGFFYVTGSGYVSWGVKEGRTIDLVTDKKKYKPGESVQLLIKSPFETATALVTVEREQVMWSKVIKMKGNAQTVDIPVENEFMPNAYINVVILKERTGLTFDEKGNDTGKPEFYAGYKAINVDASQKHLNVKVTARQKSYEPAEEVNLDIQVTGKDGKPVQAEVCLSVVDKGVLNLVGYELPDPFSYFWANRMLEVKTVSTLSDVLGRRLFKEKGENPGGGTQAGAFGSVVVRKNFKESAYYTAFIETDANGKARISFKLPDNLTTFKAMAVAGTRKDRFGRGSHDILVKKNIILKPALPNFSRPGDQYAAGVTVTNNSDKKMKVDVRVTTQDVERIKGDPNVKKVTLKPAETRAVWYQFKVDSVKTQKLTFKAVSGRYSDGLYAEIPVRIPQFTEAMANFGRVDKKPLEEQILVPGGTMRELDKAEVTLASSAMVGIKRNFDVLQEFPYDCLEQRLSKQYPLLGAGDFLLTYGLLDMKQEEIDNRIANLLKIMPQYQSGGGFKYWPNSCCTSSYLTCYATEFILDAKAKGYKFDKGMLRRAKNYLKQVAKRTVDSKYPYSKNVALLVQAYAVYVLAKDGDFMADAVNNLFEVRDRIPFSGLAYLVKALDLKHKLPGYMQPVLAKTMINKMKDEPTMTHFENHEGDTWWWVHESNVKTTAIVLDAFLHVYKRFPYAEKIARWLTTTTHQKRFLSTQEHIRLFMAFEHYYKVFEKETPDFVAEVLFNGLPKVQQTFAGRELKAHVTDIKLKDYKPGDTINARFTKEGTGMLYYLLRLKYYPLGVVEAIDRGFKVEKKYFTLKGAPVTNQSFKAGEKYIVEVTVDTKMERPFVMLDDPLPAGLRVLNPDFKTTGGLDAEKASQDSEWSGYWGNFYRSEIYFDRVQVFADYLRRGVHKWRYLVIATNTGTYSVPNTYVAEMYNPEVFGRNENRNVNVK